jgi:hypothetical protein
MSSKTPAGAGGTIALTVRREDATCDDILQLDQAEQKRMAGRERSGVNWAQLFSHRPSRSTAYAGAILVGTLKLLKRASTRE